VSARFLIVSTLAASACASSILVACATDDSVPLTEPDAATAVPELDSGVLGDGNVDGSLDDGGAVAEPCPADAFCPSESFGTHKPAGSLDPRVRIAMIRGRSASDVWAVGALGTILHFDGTSWKRSDPGTENSINGIWPRDTGEVALSSLMVPAYTRGIDLDDGVDGAPSAGGWTARPLPELGTIGRGWLTSTWAVPGAEWLWCTTLEERPNLPYNGLWRLRVAPSANGLEVGEAAPMGTCNVLPCRQLKSIHGATANELWAVGFTGATVHITNAQGDSPKIKPIDSQTWTDLHGVWAPSEAEAWAVGAKGTILRFTRGSVSSEIVSNVPTTETLRAVWGTSPTDIWAVGDKSVVLHYDGKTWSAVKVAGLPEPRPDLYTVWTVAPGRVWAAGEGVLLSLGGKP
jgi:hypothetical protein